MSEADDAAAWLICDYEKRRFNGYRGHNHVRPIFQLLDDCASGSTEANPRMSGAARWPEPSGGDNLDRMDSNDPNTQIPAALRRTA